MPLWIENNHHWDHNQSGMIFMFIDDWAPFHYYWPSPSPPMAHTAIQQRFLYSPAAWALCFSSYAHYQYPAWCPSPYSTFAFCLTSSSPGGSVSVTLLSRWSFSFITISCSCPVNAGIGIDRRGLGVDRGRWISSQWRSRLWAWFGCLTTIIGV